MKAHRSYLAFIETRMSWAIEHLYESRKALDRDQPENALWHILRAMYQLRRAEAALDRYRADADATDAIL